MGQHYGISAKCVSLIRCAINKDVVMSNFVVDNKELNSLADAIDRLKDSLTKDVEHLRNKNADVFNRYMAYNKLRSLLKGVDLVLNIAHKSTVAGHNLNDPMFHTKAGVDNGWDEIKKFDHPFFKDEDDKDDDGEMPDFLKKILADAVLGALVSRASDDRNKKDN